MTEIIVGAHFYDPPRNTYHELFRNISTDPLGENWLRKVYFRSYKPLMDSGILSKMSYDINGVLLHELKRNGLPCEEFTKNKVDNVIGTPFIHPILPDLTDDDKRIVVGAGLKKYQEDFGINPKIFWAPEAAMDQATAEILTEYGYEAFVCAPWQIETTNWGNKDNHPVKINLNHGKTLIAIPYDSELSNILAFGDKSNADRFRNNEIAPKLRDNSQIIVWTDGETYGHHAPFADLFIKYLLTQSLPEVGINPTPINRLSLNQEKLPIARLVERSAWSCHHGDLKRWKQGCGCDEGADNSWKSPYYGLFRNLNSEITKIVKENLGRNYINTVTNEFEEAFINPGGKFTNPQKSLIAAKVDALTSRTSCATFFKEPHTSGRINIIFGLEAIQHLRDAGLKRDADKLEGEFMGSLENIIDPTNRSQTLAIVAVGMLGQNSEAAINFKSKIFVES